MPFPAGGYAGEGGVSAKRPRAKTLSESQWEPYRRIIEELHRSGYTLNHIKHEMRHKHNFAPTHRQYVHRLKKWGLKRYNADREITWSPGPFGDGDNEEVALYLDSLAPLSGPESASKSSSSPSDDRITSECDSDQSEISRLYLPSPVSLGPQAHLHPGAQNNHGRGACSTEDSKVGIWAQMPWAATSLGKKKQAADFLLTLSHYEAAFALYIGIFHSLQQQYFGQDCALRSTIVACVRSALDDRHIAMVRDILQHQVNTAHDSSEALFYRLLGTHGFPHQSQNGDHSELEAYVAMASLLGLDPDDCVALASPSRPCRSIDMMGYLLLSRSINRWAEVCDASADEPLLAPGTNHMFTKADVLHQYVLQQPLYAGSLHLNQHTTVRGCATWCNQVLRNKLDSRSFFYLRDLRPLGGPAEQKGQAELTCLLWHALHTLSHTPRCTPPAWASTSEQDLGASAVELLSVVCRLVLRRPNPGMRSDNQGNGKGKEKEKASRVNLEMGIPPVGRGTGFLETALEGARALVRLEDKELWDVFLAEFLSMNEGSAAGYSSPTCISSPLDVDIVKDLQQVIATTAGITVPYQYLASSIALLPATTESSRREPEQGELYPEGLHFSALDRSFLRQDRNNMLEPYCGRDTDYGGLVVFGTGDSLRQQYRGFHQRYPLDILSVDASPIIDPSASQSFAHGNVFLGPGPGFDSAPSPHTQPLVLPVSGEPWEDFRLL